MRRSIRPKRATTSLAASVDHTEARCAKVKVAVGTALSGGPPRGSVRAEWPHTALVLGHGEDAAGPPPRTRWRLGDTSIRL